MNPFDEIAVEQAVRLKESKQAQEVTVCSIGPAKCQETLRTALAMGADKAVHVQTGDDGETVSGMLEPLDIAKTISHIVKSRPEINMIILGKQAIDDDAAQTGPMLAGLLGWSQACCASKLSLLDDGKKKGGVVVEVVREIDGGLETVHCTLPVVVTTDLRLNDPRYATLPNIMKAKKKPMDSLKLGDLIVENKKKRFEIVGVLEPSKREAGKKVDSVDELVDKLKNEAKVL